MYQIFLTKQAGKDVKKHGRLLQKKLSEIFIKLQGEPFTAHSDRLAGSLNFLYSYHFSYQGSSFRIAYQRDVKIKTITIVAVGPRENFYKILKQKLG